jgi:hypothetical protein
LLVYIHKIILDFTKFFSKMSWYLKMSIFLRIALAAVTYLV